MIHEKDAENFSVIVYNYNVLLVTIESNKVDSYYINQIIIILINCHEDKCQRYRSTA